MPDLFLKEPVLLDDWSPPYDSYISCAGTGFGHCFIDNPKPKIGHGNKPFVDFFQEDNHMHYHFLNEIVT